MNVIELSIDFSIKDDSSSIETAVCESYKEDGKGESLYKARIRKEWNKQSKEIKKLNKPKNLLASDICSERKYFLFKVDEETKTKGKAQIKCIIISSQDYKDCKVNIKLVVAKLQGVLKKKITVDIDYDTSCKIYIYNMKANDIVSSEFYLRAKLFRENTFIKNKKKIWVISIMIVIAVIFTSIFWGQIREYLKTLAFVDGEESKAMISTKVAILVNLFTGLYGTILVEAIMLFFEFVFLKWNKNFMFDIDYDITKSNVEEYSRKSIMHTVGDELEDELDITCEI